MTVEHLVECLQSDPETSILRCMTQLHTLDEFLDAHGNQYEKKYGVLRNCTPRRAPKFTLTKDLDPKTWNPDMWDERRLVDVLIALTAVELANSPGLMDALGLSAVGGVVVALPYSIWIELGLCTLASSVGCPDDPGAPGVPQYGASPGGDR